MDAFEVLHTRRSIRQFLNRRVRACHCVIMRVFFPVWTKKRGVRSCCVRTPDVFRLLAFFLHSFS